MRGRALPAFAAAVPLLYTHYLLGIAILAGFSLMACGRWRWRGWRCSARRRRRLITLPESRGWSEPAAFQTH